MKNKKIGIYGIIIKDKKILLVKNKTHFILPGGKPDKEDFSEENTLKREFKEELSNTEIVVESFYGIFMDRDPNSKKEFIAKTYICRLKDEVGEPSEEISEIAWLGKEEAVNYKISNVNLKVIESLVKKDYL
ncbi:MAG: NUDIX hydrolase [Candidatus Pacearchaeota archaeon]